MGNWNYGKDKYGSVAEVKGKKIGTRMTRDDANLDKRKAILTGVSKDKERCVFYFKKNWDSIIAIDDILQRLGIAFDFSNDSLQHRMKDFDTNERIDIRKCVDNVSDFRNDKYIFNIFIGKDNIILVVNSFVDRQVYVSNVVFLFAEFKEDIKDGS